MARSQWTDDFLTRQRRVGDPIGDAVIRTVFDRKDVTELDAFMGQLVANDEIPAGLPDEIQSFLTSTVALPTWVNFKRIHAAARLFNTYGLVSLVSLVCASLPECYTMRTGVRILDLTSQLGTHTNRRLHQTAMMVLAVMGPDGFEAGGRAIRQTQKVRLIHAAIRYRILSAIGAAGVSASAAAEVPLLVQDATRSVNDVIAHGGFDWSIDRDGWPINQEDLAFTLLTFGHVIPAGMETLGIRLLPDEYEALLHAWNVSGFILGVDEQLMAHTRDDAEYLFGQIKARQAGPSAAGARLTDALLSVVERDFLRLRILRPLGPVLTRILVGNETAKMLGLNARHRAAVAALHRLAAAVMWSMQVMVSPLGQPFQPMVPLSAWFGRKIVNYLTTSTYGKRAQLAIPPGWG
jgi:hypothetical protein